MWGDVLIKLIGEYFHSIYVYEIITLYALKIYIFIFSYTSTKLGLGEGLVSKELNCVLDKLFKNIYRNKKISSTQQGTTHNLWYPIKDY